MKKVVRYSARYLLCFCLYYSGVFFLVRCIRRLLGRYQVVILAYHSFSDDLRYLDMAIPARLFLRQVRSLRNAFKVATLSDVLAACDRATPPEEDYAVITVDDGYSDNFEPLMEAIEKYGVPSTVYVTTDCIDLRQPSAAMWVMLAIHYATAESVTLPEIGIGATWIRSRAEKDSAVRDIDGVIKLMPASEQRAVIDTLLEKCGSATVVRELAQTVMLDWNQIRVMHNAGIEFGAHTLSHPVLAELWPQALRYEIEGSIRRVKEMLSLEAVSFAYTYGDVDCVSEKAIQVCRTSGATAAVTLSEGRLSSHDRFAIPRTMVTCDRCMTPWGSFSRAMWACEMEGLVDLFRSMRANFQRACRRAVSCMLTFTSFCEDAHSIHALSVAMM
jgi:peptidoglycan/xylan/chitin deacetylase (PgdA/CDA1 family)